MAINDSSIMKNVDFILSHFEGQHELFPRTIMTSKSGGQVLIEYESEVESSKDKIFKFFREANFIDCKINAFPYNTEHTVDLDVKNKTAATFIMIDLDLKDFDSRKTLDKQLKNTLNRLHEKFQDIRFQGEAHPTVLWTGNGYHIYQPIDGEVLEEELTFFNFLPYLDGRDLTTVFLKFAEKFFTNGKADPQHSPSIKSCLIRIPGTFNSKNNEMVKIIQRWNGDRPPIHLITWEFLHYLIQKRIDKIQKEQKQRRKFARSHFNKNTADTIAWIEKLLQTPIEDYRKTCMWRILCPYLVNIRKMSRDEAAIIIKEWLGKCDRERKLDFNPQREVSSKLRNVGPYRPSSKEKLKKEQPELYTLLVKCNVLKKI